MSVARCRYMFLLLISVEYTLVVIISICIPVLSTLLSSMTIVFTEVLIPLQNETVILGREGHFFCQLRGTAEQLRFNGFIYGRPILVRHRVQGSTGFRTPRALGCSVPSAARALLRGRGVLNPVDPVDEASNWFRARTTIFIGRFKKLK